MALNYQQILSSQKEIKFTPATKRHNLVQFQEQVKKCLLSHLFSGFSKHIVLLDG